MIPPPSTTSIPVSDGVLYWLNPRIRPRPFIAAGVAMFVLYIAADVSASLADGSYSYRDQTISELSAIGAKTRPFWLAFSAVYQVLQFAFAVGVLAAAGDNRRLRFVGWLLLVAAVAGTLWWFGPMHMRAVLAAGGGTWQDTLHLVAGAISSVLFFAMIGVGAFAFGRGFRWYSFATLAAMIVFGTLMNMDVEAVADNEPTPWLGIWERIAIEGAMLWQAVFAVTLLWKTRTRSAR